MRLQKTHVLQKKKKELMTKALKVEGKKLIPDDEVKLDVDGA